MTTPADYIADHNAGRHRVQPDPRCALCIMTEQEHAERRGYNLRCTCGYQAKDQRDLDEHIEAMVRSGS